MAYGRPKKNIHAPGGISGLEIRIGTAEVPAHAKCPCLIGRCELLHLLQTCECKMPPSSAVWMKGRVVVNLQKSRCARWLKGHVPWGLLFPAIVTSAF